MAACVALFASQAVCSNREILFMDAEYKLVVHEAVMTVSQCVTVCCGTMQAGGLWWLFATRCTAPEADLRHRLQTRTCGTQRGIVFLLAVVAFLNCAKISAS